MRACATSVLVLACVSAVAVSGAVANSERVAVSITSVTFGGGSKAPRMVVNGQGFGARPSFDPAYQPQQHQACPAQKLSSDGHDYGTSFWFQDTHASAGNTPAWTAGRYRGSPELDCIGLIITSWSATKIAFRFGAQYNRPTSASAPSTYVLSKGDSYVLKVKNATFRGTVT